MTQVGNLRPDRSSVSGRFRIVVVGGGVAGVNVAAGLARSSRVRDNADVTLVDRGLSHYWKPALHTFAAGTHRPDRQKVDFMSLARRSGFRFWPGVLTGVDRRQKRITLEPEPSIAAPVVGLPPDTLDYDLLILALGSRANDFGTPGIAEHCLSVDDLTGAELFRAHLRREVFGSLLSGEPLRIAIVGGGPTGVELAAELKQALDLIADQSDPNLTRRIELTLLDHGPRLLATFPEAVSEAAAATMRMLGITMRMGAGVVGADADGLLLEGGERLNASLRIWAAGVKAPDVLSEIQGLERAKGGQLVVRPTLQTTEDSAIFALGDCAALTDPRTGRGLPATAQVAHQQASHLVRKLDPKDLSVLTPFRYRDFGSIVALGDYGGWGTIGRYTFGGARLQGLAARAAHDLLYRQHQLDLLGPTRGILAWAADRLDALVSPAVQLDP